MATTKTGKQKPQEPTRKPHAQKVPRKVNQSVGRPSKLTPSIIAKLEAAFQNGFNIVQACQYADIDNSTFHRNMKSDELFRNKMTKAQQHLNYKSREVIAQHIAEGSDLNARWWLERKAKDEFSPRREVTGNKGGPVKTQSLAPEVEISDEELNEAIFDNRKS